MEHGRSANTDGSGGSRFYPKTGRPALIYLPGLHGDTTLFTSFRKHAVKEFQILELTYPRSIDWSLDDYAQYVQDELRRHDIESGWLLAESYGSQVAWAFMRKLANSSFHPEGIILAGGFAHYPAPLLASAAKFFVDVLPYRLWKVIFWFYAKYAKFRHRHAPETKAAMDEFVKRRTPEDLSAMAHRIRLILGSDPDETVRHVNCPVYLLAGSIDPIVFTWPVLRWFRCNCPQFAGHKTIWPADHNVLGTEPVAALTQISEWLRSSRSPEKSLIRA